MKHPRSMSCGMRSRILVNFQYKDGVFVAEKVIDRGYLAIGKDRFFFFKKGE